MFQFVEKRRWYFLLSSIIILVGLIIMGYSMITTGSPFKVGIDFTGGSIWVAQFAEPVEPQALLATVEAAGYPGAEVTNVGDANTLQVKMNELTQTQVVELQADVQAAFPGNTVETIQFSSIQPSIGSEVTRAAILAMVAASVVILGFMVIAFRKVPNPGRFGATAVIAMLHDVAITLSFFAFMSLFFGWRADALILTALLTVMSFSMQDTIVMFDRIRENQPKYRGESFSAIANRSVLETIHRSLATQLNALFVLFAILLFGGVTMREFIATMLVGLVSGTYSSLFIAVPLLAGWSEHDLLGTKTKKPVEAPQPSLAS